MINTICQKVCCPVSLTCLLLHLVNFRYGFVLCEIITRSVSPHHEDTNESHQLCPGKCISTLDGLQSTNEIAATAKRCLDKDSMIRPTMEGNRSYREAVVMVGSIWLIRKYESFSILYSTLYNNDLNAKLKVMAQTCFRFSKFELCGITFDKFTANVNLLRRGNCKLRTEYLSWARQRSQNDI